MGNQGTEWMVYGGMGVGMKARWRMVWECRESGWEWGECGESRWKWRWEWGESGWKSKNPSGNVQNAGNQEVNAGNGVGMKEIM